MAPVERVVGLGQRSMEHHAIVLREAEQQEQPGEDHADHEAFRRCHRRVSARWQHGADEGAAAERDERGDGRLQEGPVERREPLEPPDLDQAQEIGDADADQ